jgi:hypothetical protein
LTQTLEEPKRLKDCRIDTDTHRRIPPLGSLQRRAAGEGALGDNTRRQPPPTARIANVLAELAKPVTDGNRRAMRGGHLQRSCFTKQP